MVDMLAKAQVWLGTVRRDSLATSREIAYIRRCTGEKISLTSKGVTIGNSDERLDQTLVAAMDVEERDYIIPRDVFVQNLTVPNINPDLGDLILETDDLGVTHRFKVATQGGESSWEWHDRERTAYRVHCIKVGED